VNKFLFMVGLTCGGTFGALLRGPFVPTLTYYFYAVLRPQYLWKFQLSTFPDLNWSLYVALAAMLSYLPWVFGVVGAGDPLRRVFPRFIWPHRMMIGFAVWETLSYLNANSQYKLANDTFEEFVKIFIMYLLATQVVRSVKQIHLLYLAVAVAIAYIAFEVVSIYVTSGYLVIYKRGFAGLDNNGAALLLAMGVPLCYFGWEMTRGWYRWGFLLAIPVIGEAVMSSYSRGAMLAVIMTAPLYLLYSRKRAVLLLCFAAAAVAVPVVAGQEIKDRFASVNQATGDDSFQNRLTTWDIARRIANDYPVFGAGIRCSNLITKQYGADLDGRTIHNIYLQIAADSGWLGLMWYLLLVGTGVGAMWSARRRLWRETDPESVRAVALLGGLECSLWTFQIGAAALSLETFEPAYLVLLLGSQIWAVTTAQVTAEPTARRVVPLRAPAPRPGVASPHFAPRRPYRGPATP